MTADAAARAVTGPNDQPDDDQPDLSAARRVLGIEADGLNALAAALDHQFIKAVNLMADAEGRVIVTGMGKSGHIATKIAATMASTGTPAFFVHPGEASHGDLGMLTAGDVVLCLSNSGETAELADIVAFSRRYAIPLVAIVGRRGSTLEASADATLVLPDVGEACPMGLTPTTSTTMSLALGDALAVALLQRKGFSADQYHSFHPGGTLGSKLLYVSEIMHRGDHMPLVNAATPMAEAILQMTNKSFGCAGVVDDAGLLIGVITDGDLRRHMAGDLLRQPAMVVMTAAPKTIGPRLTASEAMAQMNTFAITSLFVVGDDGRPVGLIHIHDLMRAGLA